MPLFEVAIIEKPTKKEIEEGVIEKLVFGPTAVIARDSQGAVLAAILGNERPTVDMSRAEVLVRPFA